MSDAQPQPRAATLTGQAERAYVERLTTILRRARLNLYYPDARRLASHLRVLHPEVHRGLYDGVELDLRSGLPTYPEWTRAKTDVEVADEQLATLGTRAALAAKAAGSDAPIHDKQLNKHDYYTEISGRELARLGDMEVRLRRVEHERQTAFFHVVFDKLDKSGLFVRYAIDLAQTSTGWSKPVVRLDAETAQHTEGFQSLIYKFSSFDAELTFGKLAGLGGLQVERVARGTVGPIYWSADQAPEPLRELFAEPDDFVATFGLDMVADDIDADRSNDPLFDAADQGISAEARRAFRTARLKVGCHLFRDRKFVVPRARVAAVRQLCERWGTRNIVYGV